MSTTKEYKNEPWCERTLSNYVIRAETPFNAEPKLDLLVKDYITPTGVHFRRNHGAIPDISAEKWTVETQVSVSTPTKFSSTSRICIRDILALPKFQVVAVLECAGNRRDGLEAIKPVNGVIWGPGTASNSRWGGCRLRDLLVKSGVPADLSDPFYDTPKHVEFAAYGDASDDVHYASSIPLQWVMNPTNMVLVAYEMNGERLTRDHGYPARIVAPGIIGARWVKWLKYIRVQDEESDNFYQQLDYKILPPNADGSNCKQFWSRFPALMELNIQSVICSPSSNDILTVGKPFIAKGYAFSGGGRAIDRVEVSLDGGNTWALAECYSIHCKGCKGKRDWQSKQWAWTLWSYSIACVPSGVTISCRAWDTSGNTQPADAIWNYRGVMNNAVFTVKPKTVYDVYGNSRL